MSSPVTGLRLNGLAARLSLVVVMAIAPLALLLGVDANGARKQAVALVEERAAAQLRLLDSSARATFGNARELMRQVSEIPELATAADPQSCTIFLGAMATRAEWVHALWIADETGTVLCSSLSPTDQGRSNPQISLTDVARRNRAVFFPIGPSQLDGQLVVTGLLPIRTTDGARHFIGLDLPISSIRARLIAEGDHPSMIWITDENGLVIAPDQRADAPPKNIADQPYFARMTSGSGGFIDDVQIDGTSYLLTFSRVNDTPFIVSVAIDREEILGHAEQTLLRALILIALVIAISILAAWLGSEMLILRWLRSLASTMQTIGRGDLKARVEIPASLGELAILGDEINQMIAKLEARTSELIQAKDEAIRASRTKADFLATMSHEIRTPLNGIIGFADLVLEKRLTNEQRKYMTYQRDAARALLDIINDVLDFSKIEANALSVVALPFDLPSLIERCVALLAPSAGQKGLTIVSQVDEDLPTALIGDGGRLRQILLNLISNAVKYTDRGEVEVSVSLEGAPALRVDSDDRPPLPEDVVWVRFTVRDTGIGISRSLQSRLFSKFSQVAGVERAQGGTGLGLAISKRLVELMGGTIGLSSIEGAGSSFWFSVPLERDPAPQRVMGSADDSAKSSAATRKPIRSHDIEPPILVVDDDLLSRELSVAILQNHGYRVEQAHNGAAALAFLKTAPVALVVMDIEMPGGNGYDTVRAIRALPGRIAETPVIGLSAHEDPARLEAARSAGMNEIHSKPVNQTAFVAAVDQLLEERSGGTETAHDGSGGHPLVSRQIISEVEHALGKRRTDEFIGQSMTEIRNRLAELNGLRSDRGHVRVLSHQLVSTAGNIGLMALSTAARHLSSACQDDAETITPLVDTVVSVGAQSLAALAEEFGTSDSPAAE